MPEKSGETGREFGQWSVTGVGMRPEDAISLLSSINEKQKSIDGCILGQDVLYWSNAARLVIELLIRQSYMPAMAEDKGAMAYVRWRYVLSDDLDRERYSLLAKSMPPVSDSGILKSAENLKRDVLDQFINGAISGFITAGAKRTGIKPTGGRMASAWAESLFAGKALRVPYPAVRS